MCLIFSFSESFFTPALKDEKGIPEFYHGFIVCVQPLFYVIFTFVIGYVIDKLPKRVFISLSFASCVLAIFITGPSYLMGLPNYLWILLVGQAFQGAALGFVFIPVLPEMIDSIYIGQGLREGDDDRIDSVISDMAAGLYGSFYSIGMIISPILGSMVYEHFKEEDFGLPIGEKRAFNKTCDVFALATLVYTVLYILFNVLPDIRKDT